MTYRHLSKVIQLGIPAIRKGGPGPLEPPPDPSTSLLSHWRLDETTLSGSPEPEAVDAQGLSNGNYVNTTVAQNGLISDSPTGTSIRLSGDGYVSIGHKAAYQVDTYSVVVYAQLQASPGTGGAANMLLFHKDLSGTGTPGGFQLGVVNDNGTIRPKLYTRNASNSPIYIGGTSGIPGASVQVGTAFMLVVVKSAGGVTVYLDKVAVGSQANPTGWASNSENITIGARGGSFNDLFNGWVDEVRVYSGALSQSEIDALPDAVSLDTQPPPDPGSPEAPVDSDQANCFPTALSTVVVSNMADLQTQVNAAPPGRHILIAANAYTGGTLTFNNNGTATNPIVIRPQGSITSVTINNNNWTMAHTSSRLVISGLQFSGGSVKLWGTHNRITRCLFTNLGGNAISMRNDGGPAARDCRIDHNEFHTANQTTSRPTGINYGGSASYAEGNSARNLIDYNYFHDITTTQPNDGFAIQGFGQIDPVPRTSYNVARGQSLIVDHNLIDNLNHPGEFCVLKIGGQIWRHNTFLRINGYFQSRMGANWEVRSNWFEGGGSIADMKMWGRNHLVIGNRVVGAMNIWVPSGVNDLNGVINDIPTSASGNDGTQDDYACGESCRYIGNQIGSGRIQVGQYFTGGGSVIPAKNNVLFGNTRDSGDPAHQLIGSIGSLNPAQTNTTFPVSVPETYTAAVKLTPSDVGRSAADPLCSV